MVQEWLSKISFLLFCCILMYACQSKRVDSSSSQPVHDSQNVEFPIVVEFEPKSEEFWFHQIYRLGERKFLGIAEPLVPVKEGIRLQIFTLNSDSTTSVISESSPAYDSMVYLPRFVEQSDGYILLTHTGEADSWGVKVLRLKNDIFEDLGFIDAAYKLIREDPLEEEEPYKLTNISDYVRIVEAADDLRFEFDCDSVYLFDDQEGNLEITVAADNYFYLLKDGNFTLINASNAETL